MKTNVKLVIGFAGALASLLTACQSGSASSGGQGNNNQISSVGTAYVANTGNGGVTICSLAQDGKLFNCNLSLEGSLLGQMGNAIYESNLYLVDYNNSRIMKCLIESNNQLQNCNVALDNNSIESGLSLNNPSTITFFESYAYIANSRQSNVIKCSVSVVDGKLENCSQTGSNTAWVSAINFNNNTAYISNWASDNNNSIIKCNVESNGDLINCLPAGVDSYHPSGIIFYNGYAYIANTGNKNVLACKIAENDSLSGCGITGSEFSDNIRSISNFESYAYIPSDKGITYCNIGSSGLFESCTMLQNTNYGFNHPFGIVFIQ